MNLALLIRNTQPGGIQVLFPGWVSSHSTSQAESLFSGSAGSKPAAGKPCLTTFGGKLLAGRRWFGGRRNCRAGAGPPPVKRSARAPAVASRRKPARRGRDGIVAAPAGALAVV